MTKSRSSTAIVTAVCSAEVLSMLTLAAFPALLPSFLAEWSLTKTDAGWINGIYYLGYLGAVPILVSLTDRQPAHRIYFAGMTLATLATFGFGLLAEGFWSAMVLRFLSGIGLAGTYMPGLKLLTDLLERVRPGADHSRSVAFYTSSFGLGTSISYFITGELASHWGWQTTFLILGLGPLAALLSMALLLPRDGAPPAQAPDTHLLDFRPVFRCRAAMGYVLAYTVHNFELFAFRSWIVAFLAFAATRHPGESLIVAATTIAAATNIVGTPASVIGNEISRRIGRRKAITLIMWSSAIFATGMGFLAEAPLWLLTVAVVFYGFFVTGDSSSITAGAVAEAPKGYKGATLAVHSCIGFTGAFLGPLVFGAVLDLTSPAGLGGGTVTSWVWALSVSGAVAALGPVCLYFLGRR
ncbi:MAG: MFS transporter [Rhodospirillaceae bacterium]